MINPGIYQSMMAQIVGVVAVIYMIVGVVAVIYMIVGVVVVIYIMFARRSEL